MYNIPEKLNKDNIGLYRDDGLAYFNNNNGHQNDKIRKELIKIFQTHGLKLKIKCNLKSIDYLYTTFDLNTGSYRPYRKPSNDTRYINAKSNHPPSILKKQIPAAIFKRISLIHQTNISKSNTILKQHFQRLWI